MPALQDTGRGITLADSRAICEFIEETVPAASMMMGSAEQRAEVRRLIAWADDCFFAPLTRPLLIEAFGAGRKPVPVSRAAIERTVGSTEKQLHEIAYLLDHRAWLAGPTLSLADLNVAAHLSVADYFGAIGWTGHDEVQTWYAVLKSRRSFQPLLADRIEGVEPPPHYSQIDT